jgi:hypothetical protein
MLTWENEMRRLFLALTITVLTSSPLLAASDGDREATQQIAAHLRNSSGPSPGEQLAVKYRGGTVWLRGRIDQPEQWTRIVRLAQSTPGVPVTRVDTSGLASNPTMPVVIPMQVPPAAAPAAAMAAPPRPTAVPPTDSVWQSTYSRQFSPAAGSYRGAGFATERN